MVASSEQQPEDDGAVAGSYVYDAQNRRIRKTISNGGLAGNIPDGTTDYLWQGWQTMEERNAGNSPVKQYVWGQYIDECVQLTTYVTLGPQNLPAGAYYLLQDLLYRGVALTNSSGAIVEAYDTDAYGNTLIFTAPGTDGVWFTDDDVQSTYSANEIIFCGYRYDAESALYYVRNRMLHPALGRWIQRDPIGYKDGPNLYQYVRGRPTRSSDPRGTDCPGCDLPAWTHLPISQDPKTPAGQCDLQCCASHDHCYWVAKCHASSWKHTIEYLACRDSLGTACWIRETPCDACNIAVMDCLGGCKLPGAGPNPGAPLYFCAKTGKYITIGKGKNYPNLKVAMKCCCTG